MEWFNFCRQACADTRQELPWFPAAAHGCPCRRAVAWSRPVPLVSWDTAFCYKPWIPVPVGYVNHWWPLLGFWAVIFRQNKPKLDVSHLAREMGRFPVMKHSSHVGRQWYGGAFPADSFWKELTWRARLGGPAKASVYQLQGFWVLGANGKLIVYGIIP